MFTKKLKVFVVLIVMLGVESHASERSEAIDWDAFLGAIHMVEASGRMNPPDGDGGRAIGPFQIWKSYWKDAVQFDPSIGGSYEDCRDYDYAVKVVKAYMRRYGRKSLSEGNYQNLARMHNSGPGWSSKRHLTDRYVTKFNSELVKLLS